MEAIASEEMASGARIRSTVFAGRIGVAPDGAQESAIAAEYRAWANALRYSHPFVSPLSLWRSRRAMRRTPTASMLRRRFAAGSGSERTALESASSSD